MNLFHRARLLIAAIACGVLGIFVAPTVAFAQDTGAVVADGGYVLHLTNPVVTALTGFLLPLAIGVINRLLQNATSRTKGFIALVIAAVVATVERAILVDGSATFDRALLLDIGVVYIPQLASYLGIWGQPGKNGVVITDKLAGKT